ncbi:dynamin family protein [Actinoplanes flavus]|uniref:Dynamin family protein n=1 Tax=Actinoplanes flavus TaxID=2820290 RepID=A0ABS3ULZ2_9ACTN|nr:dynamin family protein [Actinoplanes flavus]MBO3738738.1 dynamin family protein [Actinoplanes flavus]
MPSSRLAVTRDQHRAIIGARKLFHQHRLDDHVARLDAATAGAANDRLVIVVVGEVKRGKSSLVNALTGRDVAPVGADVAAEAFLYVVPPSEELPDEGWALAGPAGRQPVPYEDAVAFLRTGPGDSPDAPGHAEVAAASRWLPAITLVDTPGVGGIESAHSRLARWAAARAGVLLMVTDAGQVLTAPELRFLAEAAEQVETVVFAVTKADRYADAGRQIVAANRELLRRHAPRFAGAPMLAVSATLAAESRAVDDPEIQPLLEQESNIAALAEALRGRESEAHTIGLANVLRTALSGLNRLTGQLDGHRRALTDLPENDDPVQAERAALERLRARKRRWRLDLERDLGRIRQSAGRDIGRLLDELRDRWRLRISREWSGVTETGATAVLAELNSEVLLIAAHVADRLRGDLVATAAELFGNVDAAVAALQPVTASLEIALTPGRRTLDPRGSGFDPALAGSALMGASLAGKFGLAGTTVGGPLGLVAGGAWFLLNLGYRKVRVGRQKLDIALVETVTALRGDLTAAVESAIRECRPELMIAVEDHLEAEIARIEAIVAEAETAAGASAADRGERLTAVKRDLEAVADQRELVERELVSLAPPGTSRESGASDSQRPENTQGANR